MLLFHTLLIQLSKDQPHIHAGWSFYITLPFADVINRYTELGLLIRPSKAQLTNESRLPFTSTE